MRRVLIAAAVLAALVSCKPQEQQVAKPAGPAPGSREWKIQDALSAAPAEIAGAAAIMDWPATANGQPTQLRAGTNGWTCFPDMPHTPADDPMCLDGQWMNWAAGWIGHKTPNVTGVGLAYMLRGSDDASNTDPFATRPDSGKSWVHTGPHVMIIAPGARYPGVATEPHAGAPYVMFPGTPYAHIMMPSEAASHTM